MTNTPAHSPHHDHDHDHAEHDHHDHDHGHNHDHGHDHDHGHGHHRGAGHVHAPANFGAAFAIGIALNTGFVAVEAIYGFLGNSVALLADAGHNLGDVLGLAVAWLASELVKRTPTARFTYGLRGSSILAALFNAVFLLLTIGAISWEAIRRLGAPEPVAGQTVMIVAAIGLVVNGVTAWLFASGSKGDINLRGAFLHMASDALVAAGVVVAGLIILLTGWLWLDPVVSLIINAIIVWGTWALLRESLSMSMAAVPAQIDPAKVHAFLQARPGVATVHDLHIWPMSTTEVALTCHLVMPAGHPGDDFLHDLAADLATSFKISHPTVQIETDPNSACALASHSVV
ncbi:cation diffusion facilitator family transporter [Methylovirgula sp. 4M-Z18]|uniref:cation diffusion facilitator family transporter n=1 Tax=Methylovirgula sp. 4M-Z18 TaxID=2293567 RepID=UPI000E2E4CB7|nr:cation diffusion facilitator family transporter [Methylovirgula sp. 4M-Z18]RFB78983.1 cation transporter [Methylovirgula sp. 4M-Z18]